MRTLALLASLMLSSSAFAQYGAMEGRKNPGPYVLGVGVGMGASGMVLSAVGIAQGLSASAPCEEDGFCINATVVVGGSLFVIGAPLFTGGALITRNWYRDQGYGSTGLPGQIGLGFAIGGIITVGTAALVKNADARTWLVVGVMPAAMTVCYGLGIAQVILNRRVRKTYRQEVEVTRRWNGRAIATLGPVGVQGGAGLGVVGLW